MDDSEGYIDTAEIAALANPRASLRANGWRTLGESFAPSDVVVLERMLAKAPTPRAHGFASEGSATLYSSAAIRLMARELRAASRKTIAAAARAHAEALDAEGQRERAEVVLEALKRESRLDGMLDTRR